MYKVKLRTMVKGGCPIAERLIPRRKVHRGSLLLLLSSSVSLLPACSTRYRRVTFT